MKASVSTPNTVGSEDHTGPGSLCTLTPVHLDSSEHSARLGCRLLPPSPSPALIFELF
jgi:hypothetical protein